MLARMKMLSHEIGCGTNRMFFVRTWLACLSLVLFRSTLGLCKTTWNLNGDGIWEAAGNWDNGVPPQGQSQNTTVDVIITSPDGVTPVEVTANDSVGSFNRAARDLTILSNGENAPHQLTIIDPNVAGGGGAARLSVYGNIINDGIIRLFDAGTFSPTQLLVGDGDMSITGGGTIRLGADPGNFRAQLNAIDSGLRITQGPNHTIEGEGDVGNVNTLFTNQGLIDANVTGLNIELLVNDPGAGVLGFDNEGIVQASSGGSVEITRATAGGEFGGSGTYQALNESTIFLNRSVIVRDTNFRTEGSGFIQVGGGDRTGGAILHNINNQGDLRFAAGTEMNGAMNNSGAISLLPGNPTNLGVDTVLTGGGTVTLQGSASSLGSTSLGGPTLTNVDNTIQGQGRLGDGRLQIINQSTVEANVDGATLVLRVATPAGGGLGFDNQGIVQATSGGSIDLTREAGNGEIGGNGTFQALDGSTIFLNRSVIVRDTTFHSEGSGFVQVGGGLNNGGAFLRNITNQGDLRFAAGTEINGIMANSGTITIAPGIQAALGSDTMLTGGGAVTLQVSNLGGTSAIGQTLTNVNNTVQGQGQLGSGRLQIVNQGLIDANVNAGTLAIDPGRVGAVDAVTFDNQGIVQASNGGSLTLTGNGGGAFGGSGTYQALAGSEITLERGVFLRSTTLDTAGDGVVRSTFFNNTLVDVTNDGLIETSSTWRLGGTLINNGTINMQGGSVTAFDAQTEIDVTNTGSLTGVGAVDVPVVNNGSIIGDDGSFLEFNDTLRGAGSLENVRIDDIHSPGNSTAIVSLTGDYTIANTGELHLEVGGLAPGDEHDQLDSEGSVNIDGDLIVTFTDLGNDYVPEPGDQFTIITSDNPISGTFDTASFPEVGGGRILTWEAIDYSDPMNVVIEIATTAFSADFDNDGDVDANDLIDPTDGWQARFGDDLNGSNFLDWQRQLGGGVTEFAASEAVPEPTAMFLLMVTLLLVAATVRRNV